MNTKLTLTMEPEVIYSAKKYAQGKGQSLSCIVENYLKSLAQDNGPSDSEITPIVRSMKGSFHAPAGMDYKKELSKGLSKKYL